jgi:hypothetical protein
MALRSPTRYTPPGSLLKKSFHVVFLVNCHCRSLCGYVIEQPGAECVRLGGCPNHHLTASLHHALPKAPISSPEPVQVLVLIISPTRELAVQTHKVAQPFIEGIPGCCLASLIGGTSVVDDIAQVKAGATCIVGTPGRIHDVMKRMDSLSYKHFEVLILDEADRLLEMGFQRQLDAIMARLPRQRRTGLFSATQTVRAQHKTSSMHVGESCTCVMAATRPHNPHPSTHASGCPLHVHWQDGHLELPAQAAA